MVKDTGVVRRGWGGAARGLQGYGEDGAEGLGWRGGMGLRRWEEIINSLRGMTVGLEGVSGDFIFLGKRNDSKWGQ